MVMSHSDAASTPLDEADTAVEAIADAECGGQRLLRPGSGANSAVERRGHDWRPHLPFCVQGLESDGRRRSGAGVRFGTPLMLHCCSKFAACTLACTMNSAYPSTTGKMDCRKYCPTDSNPPACCSWTWQALSAWCLRCPTSSAGPTMRLGGWWTSLARITGTRRRPRCCRSPRRRRRMRGTRRRCLRSRYTRLAGAAAASATRVHSRAFVLCLPDAAPLLLSSQPHCQPAEACSCWLSRLTHSSRVLLPAGR